MALNALRFNEYLYLRLHLQHSNVLVINFITLEMIENTPHSIKRAILFLVLNFRKQYPTIFIMFYFMKRLNISFRFYREMFVKYWYYTIFENK